MVSPASDFSQSAKYYAVAGFSLRYAAVEGLVEAGGFEPPSE